MFYSPGVPAILGIHMHAFSKVGEDGEGAGNCWLVTPVTLVPPLSQRPGEKEYMSA
jgi:hypothetical protein